MSNDLTEKKFLPPANQELSTDLDYSRKNLYQLIETAMAGIEDYIPIAQQTQNARAYEVLFNAIKTTAELNEKLADHSIKKDDETHKEEKINSGDTINQNLFVGTASELQKLVENMNKKKDK